MRSSCPGATFLQAGDCYRLSIINTYFFIDSITIIIYGALSLTCQSPYFCFSSTNDGGHPVPEGSLRTAYQGHLPGNLMRQELCAEAGEKRASATSRLFFLTDWATPAPCPVFSSPGTQVTLRCPCSRRSWVPRGSSRGRQVTREAKNASSPSFPNLSLLLLHILLLLHLLLLNLLLIILTTFSSSSLFSSSSISYFSFFGIFSSCCISSSCCSFSSSFPYSSFIYFFCSLSSSSYPSLFSPFISSSPLPTFPHPPSSPPSPSPHASLSSSSSTSSSLLLLHLLLLFLSLLFFLLIPPPPPSFLPPPPSPPLLLPILLHFPLLFPLLLPSYSFFSSSSHSFSLSSLSFFSPYPRAPPPSPPSYPPSSLSPPYLFFYSVSSSLSSLLLLLLSLLLLLLHLLLLLISPPPPHHHHLFLISSS
ncbi:uncharacterized protein LOC144374723, partial [Ictidomys tridecemlineatus]